MTLEVGKTYVYKEHEEKYYCVGFTPEGCPVLSYRYKDNREGCFIPLPADLGRYKEYKELRTLERWLVIGESFFDKELWMGIHASKESAQASKRENTRILDIVPFKWVEKNG